MGGKTLNGKKPYLRDIYSTVTWALTPNCLESEQHPGTHHKTAYGRELCEALLLSFRRPFAAQNPELDKPKKEDITTA